MVTFIVDDQSIEAMDDVFVLQACLQNNIYIPHLCFLEEEARPPASCRMCFVQIEGQDTPVPACTLPVSEGLRIRTDTETVRRLQRLGFRMLLSAHRVDCKNCHANRACELQRIAKFLKIGLKAKPLAQYLKPSDLEQNHPFIDYYPNRCVLCSKCIRVCRKQHIYGMFTLTGRGFETRLHFFPSDLFSIADCLNCNLCVEVCPVGALQKRDRE